MQVKLTSISKFLHLDSFQTEAHWKRKMTFCIVYEKSQQWKGLLVNFTSLTIRNRSSAIHVHLIKQTVDIQVRNGWVCTLENVTQFRFINSSITVHIKSLQKNQAQLLPTVLSIRQKKKTGLDFRNFAVANGRKFSRIAGKGGSFARNVYISAKQVANSHNQPSW